jgi:hypothetical protein
MRGKYVIAFSRDADGVCTYWVMRRVLWWYEDVNEESFSTRRMYRPVYDSQEKAFDAVVKYLRFDQQERHERQMRRRWWEPWYEVQEGVYPVEDYWVVKHWLMFSWKMKDHEFTELADARTRAGRYNEWVVRDRLLFWQRVRSMLGLKKR